MSRQKGALNANKSRALALFRKHDYNALEVMIKLAKKSLENDDDDTAFDRAKELATFAYPKLKAVEHKLDEETGVALGIFGTSGLPKDGNTPPPETTTDA